MEEIKDKHFQFVLAVYKAGILMGDLALANGNIPKSIKLYNDMLAMVPQSVGLQTKLCKSYLAMSDSVNALKKWEIIRSIAPNHPELVILKTELDELQIKNAPLEQVQERKQQTIAPPLEAIKTISTPIK